MEAELLLRERWVLTEDSFAEIVIWRVPERVPGSKHDYKYRLALVVDDRCVLRYDNEVGKGDHKHVGDKQAAYEFKSLDQLVTDFRRDVDAMRFK